MNDVFVKRMDSPKCCICGFRGRWEVNAVVGFDPLEYEPQPLCTMHLIAFIGREMGGALAENDTRYQVIMSQEAHALLDAAIDEVVKVQCREELE